MIVTAQIMIALVSILMIGTICLGVKAFFTRQWGKLMLDLVLFVIQASLLGVQFFILQHLGAL